MDTSWKIVFPYKLSAERNAQAVYDEILKAALQYHLRNTPLLVVPVSSEIITNAIFGLNGHDSVLINGKTLTGQQLKELFITTIFLKFLEGKFSLGTAFFIVVPEEVSSCDTAIFVVEENGEGINALDTKRLKLPQKNLPFHFQVKEYVNFEELNKHTLEIPRQIDIKRIEKSVEFYSENVLVFMRELFEYRSDDFKDFFEKHPNCYLISTPHDINRIPPNSEKQTYEPVPLDSNKHNYVITFSGNTFSVVSFERPKFLLDDKTLRNNIMQNK